MIREERGEAGQLQGALYPHWAKLEAARECSSCFLSLSSLIIALFLQYSRLLGLVR